MSELYHDGNRRLQDQFETRRLADRIEERIVSPTIRAGDKEFIERMDMFFLATADEHGKPQCSYKGGDPPRRAIRRRNTGGTDTADAEACGLGASIKTSEPGM